MLPMKTQTSIQAPACDENLRTEYYLERVREFAKGYKEFEWSSVKTLLNLLRSYDALWVHFLKLMRAYRLSPAVFNILMILNQYKGEKLKQQDISKLLLVSRANVT